MGEAGKGESSAPVNCPSFFPRLGKGMGLVGELGPGDLDLEPWEGCF